MKGLHIAKLVNQPRSVQQIPHSLIAKPRYRIKWLKLFILFVTHPFQTLTDTNLWQLEALHNLVFFISSKRTFNGTFPVCFRCFRVTRTMSTYSNATCDHRNAVKTHTSNWWWFWWIACAGHLASAMPNLPGYRVLLIDPKPHFLYTFALSRFCIVGGLEHMLCVPYNNIFADVAGDFCASCRAQWKAWLDGTIETNSNC